MYLCLRYKQTRSIFVDDHRVQCVFDLHQQTCWLPIMLDSVRGCLATVRISFLRGSRCQGGLGAGPPARKPGQGGRPQPWRKEGRLQGVRNTVR